MKTITLLTALWLVFSCATSRGVIFDCKQLHVVFTNAAEAQAKAAWSEPDKITVSREGLGWDGDAAALRGGWIQTKPVALGLSWRPTCAVSVRARVQPLPGQFTLSDGEKLTGDAGDMYVRYSPDLKHWSSWQALQRTEPESAEEKRTPGRYYGGAIRVPLRERSEYDRLLFEYSQLDVPWQSDEEAAVKWILKRDPDFFAKHIPFIGYAEFLFEGEFRGSQRIQSLKVEISYGMGGLHSLPRDEAVYTNRDDFPWRYQAGKSPQAEPTLSPKAPPPPR